MREDDLRVRLTELVRRCRELDECHRDLVAMAYDGATTRAVWRQEVDRAELALSAKRSSAMRRVWVWLTRRAFRRRR